MATANFHDDAYTLVAKHLDIQTAYRLREVLGLQRAKNIITHILELNAGRLPDFKHVLNFVKRNKWPEAQPAKLQHAQLQHAQLQHTQLQQAQLQQAQLQYAELVKPLLAAAVRPASIGGLTAVHLCFGTRQLNVIKAIGVILATIARVRSTFSLNKVGIRQIQIDLLERREDRNPRMTTQSHWNYCLDATDSILKELRSLRSGRCDIEINVCSNADHEFFVHFTKWADECANGTPEQAGHTLVRADDTLVVHNFDVTGQLLFLKEANWAGVLASRIVLSAFKLDRTEPDAKLDAVDNINPAAMAGSDAGKFFVKLLQGTRTPSNRVIRLENIQLWPKECHTANWAAESWHEGFEHRFGKELIFSALNSHPTTRIIYANLDQPWPTLMANAVEDKIKAYSGNRTIVAHERIAIVGHDAANEPVYRWVEVRGLPRMTHNEVNYTHHLPVDHHDDHVRLIEKHTKGLDPRLVYHHQ